MAFLARQAALLAAVQGARQEPPPAKGPPAADAAREDR